MSELENATNTTSQKQAVKCDSGSHLSQSTSSLKGRRRITDSWDKLNIEVLGNPIELLNNKKRLLESKSMDDDIINNPPKRRLSLDPATLLVLKEGIVEAFTGSIEKILNEKLACIDELSAEFDQLKESNANKFLKLDEVVNSKHEAVNNQLNAFELRLSCLESSTTIVSSSSSLLNNSDPTNLIKNEIIKKKKSLGQRKVDIDHDLSSEERKINDTTRKKAKKLREMGFRFEIGNKQLQINGFWHHWDSNIEHLLINAEEHLCPMDVAAAGGSSLISPKNN
ncbi:hypothetical protein KQX54_014001 [Cotesia glomerata]|uniref:Uncharacterized protein n=1 Tax=Cotesia glomerata TaxID=32391 RepID=A0AAV7HZ18_COTGL|nr:hypothetical protein KQX54_014001 [Cotesia glomerata]